MKNKIFVKDSATKTKLCFSYLPCNVTLSAPMASQRTRVVELYKTLLYLGRDYPLGYEYFRARLKAAFMKNREEKDPKRVDVMIARGYYVVKEIEALYKLRKYRAMKRRYYSDLHLEALVKDIETKHTDLKPKV